MELRQTTWLQNYFLTIHNIENNSKTVLTLLTVLNSINHLSRWGWAGGGKVNYPWITSHI